LFLVGKQVMAFDRLLYTPKQFQHQLGRYFNESFAQASHADVLVRGRPGQLVRLDPATAATDRPRGLWENQSFRRIDAVAVCRDAVVVAGEMNAGAADARDSFVLAALEPNSGEAIWSETLPAAAESWGLAVDRAGRLLVTLEDGQLLCYGAE
jgi:outer membrane protein assembly factor BamB